MSDMQKYKVAVIGGGTGTFTVLSGLKKYSNLDLTAIVTMADSGGSTGRLRDEFGYLPVGDVRMALVALADDVLADHEQLRQLFLYRFEKGGEHLAGHNFGNLLLVALTDILGSEEAAIRYAARMLHARGTVLPVTTAHVTLCAAYDDGLTVRGETHIDEPTQDRDTHRIARLFAEPAGSITQDVRDALSAADLIVLGPGDLYTSVLATCVVGGMSEALRHTPAKVVYVSNLMTKFGQTTGMSVGDCVQEITKYIGRAPDVVLANSTSLPEELLRKYEAEGEYPVVVSGDVGVLLGDFVAPHEVITSSSDTLRRSYIRHDQDKLASALVACLPST
jgi:uncharacterized cofD-like protein